MKRFSPSRLFLIGLLAFFAWTCNVSEPGPDTLDFYAHDSLKYPNFDSLQIYVYVVKPPKDTIFTKLVFHGPYRDKAQLRKMVIGRLPSDTFSVHLIAFRNKLPALILSLPFTGGKPGLIETLLHPIDTTRKINHAPILSLASPDSGRSLFRIAEGATLAFTLIAKDTNAGDGAGLQPLTGSYCGTMTLDTATKTFLYKPAYTCVDSSGDSISYSVEFKAKDRGNPALWDTLPIKIVITDIETAPRWKNTIPTVLGKEGKEMILALDTLFLGDDENDVVTFSASQGVVTQTPLEWKMTPSFSQSGKDTMYLTATDNHKPPMFSKLTVVLSIADSTRPFEVTIESPTNGFITRDTTVPVRWSVNKVVQTTETTERLNKEGPNGIKRSKNDLSGTPVSDSITIIRDRIAPTKPIIVGQGLSSNPKPKWGWRSGGGGNGYYRFKLDTAELSTDTVGKKDTSFTPSDNLTAGKHMLFVQERDDAGNWSQTSADTVTLNFTKPIIKITSPPDSTVTRFDSIEVLYTVDSESFKVKRALVLGWNTLWVVGTDAARNKDSGKVSVNRDTQAPNKPTVTGPGLTKNQKPTWSWVSGGGGNGSYRFAIDNKNLTDTAGVVATSITPSENLSEGSHKLYIQERDAVGNWSAMDSNAIATIDITAPVVAIQSPVNNFVTNQSSLTVKWTVGGVSQGDVTKTLTESTNTVTQTSTDGAGNVGSASVTVTLSANAIFVNAAAASDGNGNSWSTPRKYLQTALAQATSGKELWVAKGTYKPAQGIPGINENTFDTSFIMKTSVSMYGGFAGNEAEITSRNWTTNETILSGERGSATDSTDNMGPIIFGADNAAFDGFVVEKGYRKPSDAWDRRAGGMTNENSVSTAVSNCTFRDNKFASQGGVGGLFTGSANATIYNCTFLRNVGTRSGAIEIDATGNTNITNCSFIQNVLPIYNLNGSTTIIDGCIFKNNTQTSIQDDGSATILNSIFTENGGGIDAIATNGITTVKNCGFTKNSGSAISGFTFEILNCSFVNNSPSLPSKTIYLRDDFGMAVSSSIKNSIIWGDGSTGSKNLITVDGISATITLQISYTAMQGGIAGIITSGLGVVNAGSGNIPSMPQFKNSSDLLGPDGKYFTSDDGLGLNTSIGSPCNNTGDPITSGTTAKDITGAARVQGGRIDMGAYEQ